MGPPASQPAILSTSTSLELLSQARTLSDHGGRPSPGVRAAPSPAQAGDYGATTLYDVGDLAGALPGVPVAHATAALIESEGAPDAMSDPRPATTDATWPDASRPVSIDPF